MNPNFGTIIWDVLFEPFTEEIKQLIVNDVTRVAKYDPRLSISDIVVTQYQYGIQIELALTYIPTNQTQAMAVSFNQKLNSMSVDN